MTSETPKEKLGNEILNEFEKTNSKPKPEKQLTRQQRRIKERIEAEATTQLNRLQNRFMEFVINCENPETECDEKKNIMNAQWKMYCNSKRFSEKARGLFEDWAVKVIDQYKIEVSEKEEGFGIIEPVKVIDQTKTETEILNRFFQEVATLPSDSIPGIISDVTEYLNNKMEMINSNKDGSEQNT